MDEKLVQSLIEIIGAEKSVYAALLEIAGEKKDVLVRNDVKALNAIIAKETKCASDVRRMEAMREEKLREIARAMGISAESLTLDEIIRQSAPEQQARLRELKEEFGETVRKLAAANELNKTLIRTHLDYISFCLNLLSQGAVSAETYGKSGRAYAQSASGFRLFDRRA